MKFSKNILILIMLITLPAIALSQERGEISKKRGEYVETIDKTYKVGKGGTLKLSSDEGSIRINSWFEDKVRVIAIKRADVRNRSTAEEIFEEIEVRIEKSGKDITVTGRTPWRRRRRSSQLSFEVTVPLKYNIRLETDGGSITVEDLEGNVKANTVATTTKAMRTMAVSIPVIPRWSRWLRQAQSPRRSVLRRMSYLSRHGENGASDHPTDWYHYTWYQFTYPNR